jgi:MFS family permease
MLTGLAKSVAHLYVLRFLLGVAEAGYVPGIYLYLTYWFPQRHLAQAIALFNTGFPVASVVVILWCSVAAGLCSLFGPFWSLPNEFLTGFSAAAGTALINSVGNLGGFVGAYAMGAINQRTGSFRGGFVFAGISLFASAMLILALRKRIAPEMGQSQ